MELKPLTDLANMDGNAAIDWIIENQYDYMLIKESNLVENRVMPKIAEYIEKRSQKAWDAMGNTGADDYTETCTKQEYFNFGQFRAFEDIERFIKKLSNFSA